MVILRLYNWPCEWMGKNIVRGCKGHEVETQWNLHHSLEWGRGLKLRSDAHDP